MKRKNAAPPVIVASASDQDINREARSLFLSRLKVTGRHILGVRCKTKPKVDGVWMPPAREARSSMERGRVGDWNEVHMVGPQCRCLTPEEFERLRKDHHVFMMFPVDGDKRHEVAYDIYIVNESLMDQPKQKSLKPAMECYAVLTNREK